MPNSSNNLRSPTQFQLDRPIGVRRANCGKVVGRFDEASIEQIGARLAMILDLAE